MVDALIISGCFLCMIFGIKLFLRLLFYFIWQDELVKEGLSIWDL